MSLVTKARTRGKVESLLLSTSREQGLEKQAVERLELLLSGIAGDCHAGETRPADSRTLMLYKRNTPIRNVRQVTILSVEELVDIAEAMGLDEVRPEWLGANMVLSGIRNLTLLPPSTRLQFPSGATIVVDMENAPCRQVADVIREKRGDAGLSFVKHATHKRGLTAWVEREGEVLSGDEVTLFLPPQRIWQE